MPALQGILRWIPQLTDGRPQAVALRSFDQSWNKPKAATTSRFVASVRSRALCPLTDQIEDAASLLRQQFPTFPDRGNQGLLSVFQPELDLGIAQLTETKPRQVHCQ